MSEESEDQDKQFEATQKKLDDAREKGEIAKSADLTTAAAYAGFLAAAMFVGPSTMLALGEGLATLLERPDTISDGVFAGNGTPFMTALLGLVGREYAAWAVLPGGFALLALLAQRGLVVAPTKLAPKISRISPIKGFGNKFGREGLFEFVKSTVKLSIYSAILGVFLTLQFPAILETLQLTPAMATVRFLNLAVQLMFIVLVVSFALGIVDYIWQSAQHQRKNRMSRKEMMDEQKQSEGDPMMKQQRRQKAVTIAMNQMLADVPDADVVIVNPTHFAVALKWDRRAGKAPVCVAKGADEIAARIREIAEANSVPIHSDPPTARALHASLKIGDEIAHEHYRAVAAAIRFADRLRRAGASG